MLSNMYNKFITTDRFFFYSKGQKNLFIIKNSKSLDSSFPVTFSITYIVKYIQNYQKFNFPSYIIVNSIVKDLTARVEEEYTFFVLQFAPITYPALLAGMRVRISRRIVRTREVEKVRYQMESSKSRGDEHGRSFSRFRLRAVCFSHRFSYPAIYRGTGRRVRVYV